MKTAHMIKRKFNYYFYCYTTKCVQKERGLSTLQKATLLKFRVLYRLVSNFPGNLPSLIESHQSIFAAKAFLVHDLFTN